VALVAALVPRALADSPDGMPSLEPPAELAPTDTVADTGRGGGGGGGEAAEASAPEGGGGGPEPDAQLAAAEHELQLPQQVDAGQGDGEAGDRLAAAQGRPGDPAGCGASSCSGGSADPGRLTATVVRGVTGSPGGDQPDEPEAPRESPQDARYEANVPRGELPDPWEGLPPHRKLGWTWDIYESARRTRDSAHVEEVISRVDEVMPELDDPSDRSSMEKLRAKAVELRDRLKAQETQKPPGGETGTGEQQFSGVQAARRPAAGVPPVKTLAPEATTLAVGVLVLSILTKNPELGLILRQAMPTLFPLSTPGAT